MNAALEYIRQGRRRIYVTHERYLTHIFWNTLKHSKLVEHICFSHLHMSKSNIVDLVDMLRVNTSVTLVDVTYIHVSSPALHVFLDYLLKANTRVTHVNMSYHCLDARGARVLAEVIKRDQVITHLRVSSMHLGDAFAVDLADALKVNTSLESLNLNDNDITAFGAELIADAMTVNRSLTSLSMNVNRIGNVGISALAEMLKTNQTLQQLSVHDTKFNQDGAKVLAEGLKANVSIRKLSLMNNTDIGSEGIEALCEAAEINTSLLETCHIYDVDEVIHRVKPRNIRCHLLRRKAVIDEALRGASSHDRDVLSVVTQFVLGPA